MAGTRALFASIGASVTLVCAAALSLLAVSAVFAFGGWSDPPPDSVRQPDLIFAGSTLSQTATTGDAPMRVSRASKTAGRSGSGSHHVGSRSAGRSEATRSAQRTSNSTLVNSGTRSARIDTPKPQAAPPPPPPPPAPHKTTGDRVRKAGDSLSATVQSTGDALADVTQPLAPPVSTAVQQVLNFVAELVRRPTSGLGSALDTLLPQQR